MMAGRFVFALGGESMAVAQSSIVAVWFKGNELAFAMGLNMSVSRLGSVANGSVLPRVVQANDGLVGTAFLVGFFVCIFSLGNAISLVTIDIYAEKKDGKVDLKMKEEDKFKFRDIF